MSRPRPRVQTLDTETAHERHSRLWQLKQSFEAGRKPVRPASRRELDVLKERKRFIHATDVDPRSLSWEDALALKYYDTLFREFTVVNLKHYKHGAIALRWRTETEVLAGTAQLTCASMRCKYHLAPASADEPDPESTAPLVPATLTEFEVPFAYAEDGEQKSALVKVVLCRACGKKLLHGREKSKDKERERRGDGDEQSGQPGGDAEALEDDNDDADGDDDDGKFAPDLPPDLAQVRYRDHRHYSTHRVRDFDRETSRRRSASPHR